MYLSTFFSPQVSTPAVLQLLVILAAAGQTPGSDLTAGKGLAQQGDWSCSDPHGTRVHHAHGSAFHLLGSRLLYGVFFNLKCCAGHRLFGSNSAACKAAGSRGQPGQQSPHTPSVGAGPC